MNNIFRNLLIVFLAMSIFVGCGGSGKKEVSTANRVVEHLLNELERLNPQNSTGANETYVEEMIYERLIRINPKTMEVNIPWLAESMPIESPDHMTFDFTLRKGVKFADGKELTGNDVIFSLKALKNPFNTMNGQKRVYVDGIHSCELVDGDPYRIRFTMWKAYFLTKEQAFADVLYVLPKHIWDPEGLTDKYSWDDIASIIEKPGAKTDEIDSAALAKQHANPAMKEFAEQMMRPERDRDPKFIQGSGPYKLAEWKTGDRVTIIRNPNYTNKGGSAFGEVHPDTLIYKVITDWSAAITAVKSKDVDLMGFVQPPYFVKVDTTQLKYVKKVTFPLGAYGLLNWNNRSVLFSDKRVRWAMAHLIDRKTIIDKVLYGLASPTESPCPEYRKECNKDLKPIDYNIDEAKRLLKEAGWEDHDGDGVLDKTVNGKSVKFDFVFLCNQNETRKQILLIVAESLRKVGIKADVQTLEWAVFLDRLRDHNFDATYGSWQNDPYETDNYQLYHSSQAKNRGSNYPYYNSPEADHLLEAIRAEFDPDKRLALQREFQRVLYEDQPTTILWNPMNPSVWVDRFNGVFWDQVRPGYIQALWEVRGAAGGGVKAVSSSF
jgi:peptide/nickel transport system substrate-binding protein